MHTKKFQNLCAETVNEIDRKHNITRDQHFSFTQLIEEVGELAKAINTPKLRSKELNRENLNEEFADVLLQLAILAKIYDIDFETSVKTKIEILKKRHGLE